MGRYKYSYYLKSIYSLLAHFKPRTAILKTFLGKTVSDAVSDPQGQVNTQVIHLPRQEVSFRVRGSMDIWSVKETWIDRFYERFGTAIGKEWTIVDIGGGIGDFTTLAAKAHPGNQIYAFEPTLQSYKLLVENLARNQVSNAQAFNQAIWSEEGFLLIDTRHGQPGQFTSHNLQGSPEEPGLMRVESISLQEAFQRLAISKCDLLKLDCEGAEYPILYNASSLVLECVERIVMEYHDQLRDQSSKVGREAGEFPTNHHGLQRFLQENGYKVQVQQNYVHAELGYLYAWR